MHFLMPFTLVLMLTSRWWFVALFSREFIASLPVFNTFLLLVISRVIFSFPVLNGLQDKRIALIAACSEALFNVVLCFILVPYWGLLGIALANFFAYGLEKVIYSIRLQRRHQVPVSAYLNVPVWALYTLLLILAWAAQIFWL
jgi:O-antigen/teichoic acid export membrane protein